MTKRLNNPAWLIVGALATWRLATIIHREEIAQPVREAAGVDHQGTDDQERWVYPKTFLGKLLECFWCTSVWSAGAVVILLLLCPPLALVLALSAVAIWLHENNIIEGD